MICVMNSEYFSLILHSVGFISANQLNVNQFRQLQALLTDNIMLRRIRIILAAIFFVCITMLFLDLTGFFHTWFGWMARIQFLPALMALNLGVIIALVALTLVCGRVYCSVICPLGVMQDCISWISGRRRKKKYRFSSSPAVNWLRYGVLGLFIIAMIAGIGSVVTLLAPYSSYGRITWNLMGPVYDWGNNLLAKIAAHYDSYAFYEKEVWIRSIPTFVIAAVTFVALAILAWRNGRTYCNTICPVGTVLGALSRVSLFGIRIDKDKCVECGLCSRRCNASCIDGKNHRVDYSRCVDCMDCIGTCTHGAISYGFRWNKKTEIDKDSNGPEKIDESRRALLTVGTMAATVVVLDAQIKKVDGGLAVIEDKKIPKRKTPILPPGAISLKHMARHCTGCQLCVSACPNNVLRPSGDIMTLMQPESSYERGYCRPECTECSQVCPAGAITPITRAEKSAIQIGHAVWIKQNCIPVTEGVDCGNCARHCPTGAILMVPLDSSDPMSVQVPAVNTARCIGCGACENLCPARPFSAIYVEGNSVHTEI